MQQSFILLKDSFNSLENSLSRAESTVKAPIYMLTMASEIFLKLSVEFLPFTVQLMCYIQK
jgi:hypothetical protein